MLHWKVETKTKKQPNIMPPLVFCLRPLKRSGPGGALGSYAIPQPTFPLAPRHEVIPYFSVQAFVV